NLKDYEDWGQQIENALDPESSTPPYIIGLLAGTFQTFIQVILREVGEARTHDRVDYEEYGPAFRVRYQHGYHGVVPPIALIAPLARVARSTNRSTPYHGDHRMPATERYRPARPINAYPVA